MPGRVVSPIYPSSAPVVAPGSFSPPTCPPLSAALLAYLSSQTDAMKQMENFYETSK